jgi:succinate-semialdehyde dehydrogenase / glutarate-semialdehyde dehydrogenase
VASVAELIAPSRTGIYVDGEWRPAAGGEQIEVRDPATTEVIGTVASASVKDALEAVAAAYRAFPAWSALAPRARSEILRRAFELMIASQERLAELMVRENGKPLAEARSEVAYAAEFFRWFSEEAVRNIGSVSVAPGGGNRILVEHQPVGVALLVTPWNFPAAMATRKIGPALAAGCTLVLKPASETPLTALAIADLLGQAGLPPGVLNVIPSRRSAEIVGAMLRDSRVRKLSFTGSTEVGRILLAQAADNVISCSMELGGNAPFIVLADADIESAVSGALVAKMRNNGQSCVAANRFYVDGRVAEEFSTTLARAMADIRVGSGLEAQVTAGPLINYDAREKVSALVEDAVASGARLRAGGRALSRPGFFYPPTVVTEVAPNQRLVEEEIFGPVAPIVAFATIEEAIELANTSDRGLAAYVYTKDLSRGLAVAEAIESGMVGLNRGFISDPAAPFGGVKQSGLGREGAHEGLVEFLEAKYIAASW